MKYFIDPTSNEYAIFCSRIKNSKGSLYLFAFFKLVKSYLKEMNVELKNPI